MRVRIATLAVTAALLAACGGKDNTGKTCTTNADCGTQVCNPYQKICEDSCVGGADGGAAAICTKGTGCEPENQVCVCGNGGGTGGDSCSDAFGTGNACNPESRVCETTCTSDSACSGGKKCDPKSKTCVTTVIADCTLTPCTGINEACDPVSKACVAGCTGSSCDYANYCDSDGLCKDVSALSTCGRDVERDSDKLWNRTAGNGPIAFGWKVLNATKPINCSNGALACKDLGGNPADGVVAQVSYYDPNGDFATSAPYGHTFYVVGVAANSDTKTACASLGAGSNGSAGTITVVLCRESASTPDPDIYLQDTAGNYGNSLCGTWQ